MLSPVWHWLRSPRRALLLTGFAVIALILVAAVVVGIGRYQRELTNATRELRALDLLLAQETSRSLEGVDLVLASVADQVAIDGVAAADEFTRVESSRQMHEFLRARVAGLPQLNAVTLIDSRGQLINFSRYWPIPEVNLADRHYFQYLLTHEPDGPYLSEPVINRGTGTWTFYVTRRISDPQGGFVGLVLGAIELDYFQRFYASLRLDKGSIITLWHQDGTLLAQYPSPDGAAWAPPASKAPASLMRQWGDGGRVGEARWGVEGLPPEPHLIATQFAGKYPIVVALGRDKSVVLRNWYREVVYVGGAVVLAVLSILFLMWALLRQFGAYEAMNRAAAAREQADLAREKVEDALRHAQKLETVGRLTGGLAHDFNNVLAVVIGNLELLKKRLPAEGRPAEFVEHALQGAQRGAMLTQRMLSFARKQDFRPVPVDLAALVQGMRGMLQQSLGPRITIALTLPAGLPPARADANQLELAILNLAVNARDAMPDGGQLRIALARVAVADGEVAGLDQGDHLCISIVDTGGGMAPDVLARATEPFFTTKGVGKGTGLGLSMVQDMAERAGGRLVLKSQLGEGTVAELWLPVMAEEGAARPRPSADPAAAPVARDRPLAVMVVDDDALVLRNVAAMLEDLGHVPVEAPSARSALALLQAGEKVDLVLTDYAMPGMNGVELAWTIRTRRPDLPVVLMSGYADLPDDADVPVLRLIKPFRQSTLAQTVADATRLCRSDRA